MLGKTRLFAVLFSVLLLNIITVPAMAITYVTAEENAAGLISIEINTAYQSFGTAGYTVNGSRNLYRIDLATGNAVLVGSLGVSGDFEALAFSPDGSLYALEDSTYKLYTLNLFTGAATLVGSTGITSTSEPGMAFDDNGRLWVIGGGSGRLWEVNPNNALATLVGTTGISSAWALAFHQNTFYTVAGSTKHLYQVNTGTALATQIGSLGISFGSQHGMSTDGVNLWLLTESGSKLYKLNTVTGIATSSPGIFGASSLESLAISTNTPIASVSITPVELPSWLSFHDNGDGTALIQGYPALESGYDFTLRLTDSLGAVVDRTYSVSTKPVNNQIEVDDNDLSASSDDEDDEGYDYSKKEEYTFAEESAGAIEYLFVLMLMLIAGLRLHRRIN
jgi:hypothetical protein